MPWRIAWGCLCLLTGFASSLPGEEVWPSFRGPRGDGTADVVGLPVTWSETENVVWKTPVPGFGWSSPIIWGEEIWLTTATVDGSELSYLVLDRETGRILHDSLAFHVAEPHEGHKFNSFASPTPVVDGERAYLSWGSPGLLCVDMATRAPLWVRRDLECNHYRGPGSSPILFKETVILHYDGFDYQYVIALDKLTGETVWWTDRPFNFGTDDGDRKKAYATPLVIEAGGRTQLISPTSFGVFSYDPRTGQEIWRARCSQFSSANRPVFDGERIYFSSGFGKGELFAIDPTGTGDVTETHIVWQEPKTMPSKPSPLVANGLVYLFNDKGVATCLEAATGQKVWQHRLGGNFSSSPIFSDGRIYIFNEEGGGFAIRPGREFELLAENQLDEGCLASPAVAAGALFVRTRSHLYRLDDPKAQRSAGASGGR